METDPFFVMLFILITAVAVVGFSSLVFDIAAKGKESAEQALSKRVEYVSKAFEILSIDGGSIYVRNTGTVEISGFRVYVDGVEVAAAFQPVPPASTGIIAVQRTGRILKVVSGEFSQTVKTSF